MKCCIALGVYTYAIKGEFASILARLGLVRDMRWFPVGRISFHRWHIVDIELWHSITFCQYFRRLIGVVETVDYLICAPFHDPQKQFHIVNGDVILQTEQIKYRRLTTLQ